MKPKQLCVALVFLGLANLVCAQIDSPLYRHDPTPLRILNQDGSVIEMVTVVVSERADQARGLMFVRHLPINMSMLFLYPKPTRASFWMKNTYVSLDLVFIGVNNKILHIIQNAEPLSTQTRQSPTEVIAVLEVNAGLCQKLGIKMGDTVQHRVLER